MRALKDWLFSYMEYTENTEPPELYHLWTGVSVIAAALQRKCHLDWGHLRIFPNMYIVLVGPPGGRKGTAMKIGKQFLTSTLRVPIASEYSTRAALILSLEESATTLDIMPARPTDKPKTMIHCSLTIFSEELAVFLGDKNPDMVITLTDLFDCPDNWRYKTKNSGSNELINTWLNLCGATTPSLLQSSLTQDAVGGGLTSRIVFVVEHGKQAKVPFPFLSEKQEKLKDLLEHDLLLIHELSGRFVLDEEAICVYANWYQSDTTVHPDVKPLEGYNERKALHLMKLAMICSASRSNDMVITRSDLEVALSILARTEKNMAQAYHGFGRSPDAQIMGELITFMAFHNKVEYRHILDRFKFEIEQPKLVAMLDSLVVMSKISRTIESGKTFYKWLGVVEPTLRGKGK